MLTWRKKRKKSRLKSQRQEEKKKEDGPKMKIGLGPDRNKRRKNREEKEFNSKKLGLGPINLDTQGPIFQLLFTPNSCPIAQAQSEFGPDESKAQLKWAPATSKCRSK
jgi:hypothetical protein